MNKNSISFASSVSHDKNFDPMDTLLFCKANAVNNAQLYMDKKLLNNRDKIVQIAKFAKENSIALLCHSPVSLNSSIVNKKLISAFNELLKYHEEKKIVIHYDPDVSIADSMMSIESLINAGLVVCLENFYPNQDQIAQI